MGKKPYRFLAFFLSGWLTACASLAPTPAATPSTVPTALPTATSTAVTLSIALPEMRLGVANAENTVDKQFGVEEGTVKSVVPKCVEGWFVCGGGKVREW